MASFSSIRDGLKTRLATIANLNTYDVMPENPIAPAAIVGGPMGKEFQVNYVVRGAPPGVVEWILPVWIYIEAMDGETAQNLIDLYLGTTGARSVRRAIEGDRTLGGVAQSVRVTKVENYTGQWAEFRVEVLTKD
jgi:hypothetical protein